MSEEQIKGKIANYQEARKQYNKNNPKENSIYSYYTDMIERFTAKLPKREVKLHVVADSLCESCE